MHEGNSQSDPKASIRAAHMVIPCAELQPTLDVFLNRLRFRLDRISPADDPRSAWISGHGLRLLLRRGDGPPGTLLLSCEDPAALGNGQDSFVLPNGTRVELEQAGGSVFVPPGRQELVICRAGRDADWVIGRAGMRYRDLIPGRQGGRFIASHIQIQDGGPVPDNVHFHAIRFQMIYCAKGWVRVCYEDQGPSFVLEEGDCVLQPPLIRHRVLESSPGLEVIEVACPAEHDTFLDHELDLPTAQVDSARDFSGQRFVRHEARGATWKPWRLKGFEGRDLGIAQATGGLADAREVRVSDFDTTAQPRRHDGELLFLYVLAGSLTIEHSDDEVLQLSTADSITLPAGISFSLRAATRELRVLEIRLPAEDQVIGTN